MSKKQTNEATTITREHLTDNSRVLLDSGRIAIHEDCILALQLDGTWIREPFELHLPQGDAVGYRLTIDDKETPEPAAGDE